MSKGGAWDVAFAVAERRMQLARDLEEGYCEVARHAACVSYAWSAVMSGLFAAVCMMTRTISAVTNTHLAVRVLLDSSATQCTQHAVVHCVLAAALPVAAVLLVALSCMLRSFALWWLNCFVLHCALLRVAHGYGGGECRYAG
jgi:hypothetical protein